MLLWDCQGVLEEQSSDFASKAPTHSKGHERYYDNVFHEAGAVSLALKYPYPFNSKYNRNSVASPQPNTQ